jgi:hypothetical protein
MTAILEVPVPRDIAPVVSSDRIGEIIYSDKVPWSTIALRTVPVSVIEQVIQVIEVNDVIGATIGYGEPVVIHIDEIRSTLKNKTGSVPSQIKMQINVGTCISLGITGKHSCNSDCQQDFFSHMRFFCLLKAGFIHKAVVL